MIDFPVSKINLGLSVISKRPDGFHELATIFYPVRLRDALEINPAESDSFIQTGLRISGLPAENLVLRAYEIIKSNFPAVGPLEIRLHKVIPMGAGLGGGSSDAAFMLQILNRNFQLNITKEQLLKFALELGSDCPFFIQSIPCYATGRGEILEPVNLDLSGYSILLIHPTVQIGTAWAFSRIQPRPLKMDLRKISAEPIENWPDILQNDFEIPVFQAHPAIQKIKESLYKSGALFASMTGSGSTVYGIFPKNRIPDLFFDETSQTRII